MEKGHSRRAFLIHARWDQKVWANKSYTTRVTTAFRQEADTRRCPKNILCQKQKWKRESFTFQYAGATRYVSQRVQKTWVFWHNFIATTRQVAFQARLPQAVSSKINAYRTGLYPSALSQEILSSKRPAVCTFLYKTCERSKIRSAWRDKQRWRA
jgi:hypothetical protein